VSEDRQLTKDQLTAQYASQAWRDSFLKILHVSTLLRRSVIRADYRIPDEMNTAIYLTPAGNSILQTLKTKNDVPVKEAKLMCLLVLAYREPLVDVERTNYRVLLDEVGKQIASGDIRYPFVYGRLLYDKAAQLFADERDYLSVADTAKLLESTPQGVWQVDNLVTGPFGVLESSFIRNVGPHTNVPLQHCADRACRQVHYVQLTTAYEAPVNAHRYKLSRLLEAGGREPSDWNGFIDQLTRTRGERDRYDDLDPASLTFWLGDALADSELRLLLAAALDRTGGALREIAKPVGLDGRASSIAESLSRAQIMQLLFCVSDRQLAQEIDRLIANGGIDIPSGEIRRARVNQRESFGYWQLRAEAGHRGMRVKSAEAGLPLLRLRRLVGELYDGSSVQEMNDLDWLLRRTEGMTAGGKLEDYLRSASPADVLRNLVLARREKAEKARALLAVEVDLSVATDEDVVASLLWKLGFDSAENESRYDQFLRHQDEIVRLVRAALLSAASDEEPIRKSASVYFQDLEWLLTDCLAYTAWALTTDHFVSERPFVYRPSADEKTSLESLNGVQVPNDKTAEAILFSEDNTLYPLVRGFGILATSLRIYMEREAQFPRGPDTHPSFADKTKLKRFPFAHSIPFLDLQPEAQKGIIDALEDVGRRMLRHDVPSVRNNLSHFRRTTVDMSQVLNALEEVKSAVSALESAGFVRIPYRRVSTTVDEWGRRTVTLAASGGPEVAFTRPSAFDWLGLPGLSEEQYLMHAAVFAAPNEVLRFKLAYDSPYEDLWTGYPSRRESSSKDVANQSEPSHGAADIDSRESTRAG